MRITMCVVSSWISISCQMSNLDTVLILIVDRDIDVATQMPSFNFKVNLTLVS